MDLASKEKEISEANLENHFTDVIKNKNVK